VKKITISIIAGLIGLPLLFMLSARLFLDSERTNTNHGTQAAANCK
jgi:hypothetical protein